MMTRKHYIAVAKKMNSLAKKKFKEAVIPGYDNKVHSEYCGVMADSFAEDNPRFDRQRFLEACGVQPLFI